MLKCYLTLFFYSLRKAFYHFEFRRIPNTFFFITNPYKQMWLQITHNPTNYSKCISAGQLLRWNFMQAKFYKKTLKSITPTTLLLWRYFLDLLREVPFIFVKNFNFFLNTFLIQFFEVMGVLPLSIVFKTPYVVCATKMRRIKKRVLKNLKLS